MKKKLLTIILTALLLLSTAALGVSTVFRVEQVTLIARLTPQAEVTAEGLQAELEKAYAKDSIFSVKDNEAEKVVSKYSYLRIIEFKKSYPNAITVTVVEDTETYAVESEGGYFVLNGEGIVVAHRAEVNNREDGAPNLLVKGLTVTGKVGGTLSGDSAWGSMLALCQGVDDALNGIRRNVTLAEVYRRTPQCFYRLTMAEGVKIYIEEPDLLTDEKADVAIEKYLSLSGEERLTGRIAVRVVEGQAVAEYKSVDEF